MSEDVRRETSMLCIEIRKDGKVLVPRQPWPKATISMHDSPIVIHYNPEAEHKSEILTMSGLWKTSKAQRKQAIDAMDLFIKKLRSGGPKVWTREAMQTVVDDVDERRERGITIQEATDQAWVSKSSYYRFKRRLAERPAN